MPQNTPASPRTQPVSRPASAETTSAGQTPKMMVPLEDASRKEAEASGQRRPSKLDELVDLLRRPEGASLADLAGRTGWQAHSIRGAIAGSLKRKGHVVTSRRLDGIRRYWIEVLP
jgi:Protein of unknown function (DUF3489)